MGNLEQNEIDTKNATQSAPDKPPKKSSFSRFINIRVLKSIHLGIGFFFLFTAYSTTETLLTTLFAAYGAISLAIIYCTFGVACLLAPVIVYYIGPKISMILSSAAYVLFIGCTIPQLAWLYLMTSAILGIAASLLWVGEGLYMSRLAQDDDIGKLTGIFYGVYLMCMVAGYIIVWIILVSGGSEKILLGILTGLGGIGFCILCLIRPVPKAKTEKKLTLRSRFVAVFRVLGNKKMLLLLPYLLFQGTLRVFEHGVFTKMLGLEMIPKVFIGYGTAMVIGSFLWGKIFDRFSWIVIVISNVVLTASGYMLCVITNHFQLTYLFYPTGVIMGLNTSCIVTTTDSSIIELFSGDPSSAFSFARFVLSVFQAILYAIIAYVPYYVMVAVVGTFCLLGVVCYVVLRILNRKTKVEVMKEKQEEVQEMKQMKKSQAVEQLDEQRDVENFVQEKNVEGVKNVEAESKEAWNDDNSKLSQQTVLNPQAAEKS